MKWYRWYKRYPEDYKRDTSHLSMLEDGAYTRMLDHASSTRKPLPRDRERLYMAMRCQSEAEKKAVDFVLSEFWVEGDEGWVNHRAEKEIDAAKKRSKANQKVALEREAAKRNGHEGSTNRGTSGPIHPLRGERYIAETQHLTMNEHGAYSLMLKYADWTERPLPKDQPLLYYVLRAFTAEEKAAVDFILDEFWTLTERGWIHSKMEEYREKIRRRNALDAHRQWARKQILRLVILQKNLCGICGTQFTLEEEIEVDHILPISKFPAQLECRELSDIQASHKSCNRKKRDRVLGEGLS